MRRYQLTLLVAVILGVIAVSCSPDSVQPKSEGSLEGGAFLADSNIHQPPDPKCGYDMFTPMVFNYFGQTITLGQVEIVNGTDYLYVIFYPISGLSVKEAAVWHGKHSVFCPSGNTDPACKPPMDGMGNTDQTLFQNYEILSIPQNPYSIRIPLVDLWEANSFAVWTLLIAVDQNGNPIFNQTVWAKGKSLMNGGEQIDYILAICPFQTCEPWKDGNPKCKGACSVPVYGPGDDLSDYDCTTGKGEQKVTVCHMPPGNPTNVQQICIAVSALPAHIVDFKPATNPCMGHHSGCHLGPCNPCGPGSSGESRDAAKAYYDALGCTGSAYGGNN